MKNHTVYAFISVLLGLIMFFAYQSFSPAYKGIDVLRPSFDGSIVCGLDPCGRHNLLVEKSGAIRFQSQYLSAEELSLHLESNHQGCDLIAISIIAPADLDSSIVIEITDILKKNSDNVNISWLVKN